jgi:hypothetical protein
MATQPYEYPTPAMLDGYRAASRSASPGPRAIGTPIDTSSMVAGPPEGFGRRLGRALAISILGADAGRVLFPPQQPLQPIAQPLDYGAVGRPWDFPVGWNTRVTPRTGKVPFAVLRDMASAELGYDVLRVLIERVKDDIVSMEWTIGPEDKKKARDARCDEVQDFLEYPDKVHSWADWLRMLLEQMLVYDAPAIWLRPTRGGDLYSLELLDGSMIAPKIMADGRLPPPDYGPAYQQVIKGLPAVDYVQPVPKGQPVPLDPNGQPFPELLYKPRNPRVDSLYGYSPVEQIMTTVYIAHAREKYLLEYYKNGSTADLIFQVPETWNPDQIAQFDKWWNAMLSGNLENRRRAQFVPHGVVPFDVREKALTDESDQWLIRICCFAFGLSPMPFIKMMNRASGETHAEQQKEEGTMPYLNWVANLMHQVIDMKFGYRDLCFRWEEEVATDPLEEAQRFKVYLDTKVYHPDEVRQKLGDDAMPAPLREQMDMPNFSETVNATVLPPEQQAEADARQQQRDDAAAEAAAAAPAPGVAGKMGKGGRGPGSSRSTRSAIRY